MKKFEAESLNEAYSLATESFGCSITELNTRVLIQPRKGFMGFFKRNALIECELKHPIDDENNSEQPRCDVVTKEDEHPNNGESKQSDDLSSQEESKETIFDNFYDKSNCNDEDIGKIIINKTQKQVLEEINKTVQTLFDQTCFDLDKINVSFYDDQTVFLEFTGKDNALLIGKEGYRYKALSYILFNWINEAYNLMVRVEVADFLKNQEENIKRYVETIVSTVETEGQYRTKILDTIWIHTILKDLRNRFPNKYVGIKQNNKGLKYIVVNDYKQRQ